MKRDPIKTRQNAWEKYSRAIRRLMKRRSFRTLEAAFKAGQGVERTH